MTIEENVREEAIQTEDVAAAKERVDTQEKEASAVLGKFKDVDALAKAYESLQAEFTRRSQKLRSLEKEVENFKESGERSGAEKLRKTAQARREEAKAFDEFVSTAIEGGSLEKPPKTEVLEGMEKGTEERLQADDVSSERGLGNTEKSEEADFDELFQRAFQDERVRLKIVGEYLSSLGKTSAPVTAKGVGVYVTPPRKARTLGQAADMALSYLKKPVQ